MNDIYREAAMIAYTNDTLREHHLCGEIIFSEKVTALPTDKRHLLFELIRRFDDFNPRIDPKGWHDFGSICVDGEYYYFVIEQVVTRNRRILARIMRILHTSEYPQVSN